MSFNRRCQNCGRSLGQNIHNELDIGQKEFVPGYRDFCSAPCWIQSLEDRIAALEEECSR